MKSDIALKDATGMSLSRSIQLCMDLLIYFLFFYHCSRISQLCVVYWFYHIMIVE